jgi:flagellar biogenesis protein FliO
MEQLMKHYLLAWLDPLNPLSGGWIEYAKLMFVVGGILILAFLTLRFWLPRMAGVGRPSSGPIRVLAHHPLEPRKALYVVGVGKTMLLMATSEAGIQLMTILDPNDLDDIHARKKEAGAFENRFLGLMNATTGRSRDLSP